MGEAETLNPIFTELTTAKIVWLAVIVACTAVVLVRGQRRRRRQAEAQQDMVDRRDETG